MKQKYEENTQIIKKCAYSHLTISIKGSYYSRILSDTKDTIVILHCVHKTALTTPWKGLPDQLQCCCCPRSEYAFVVLRGCIEIIKDLILTTGHSTTLEFGTKNQLLTHETLKQNSSHTDREHRERNYYLQRENPFMFADNLESEFVKPFKNS